MLVLSLTPCVLQVSAAWEAVSLKGRAFWERSGRCLGRQRPSRSPPALHLPQAGVPQVCKAVQLPAPGGQDGKPVYPVPGYQGDNEVGTNRLSYLHKVSETSSSGRVETSPTSGWSRLSDCAWENLWCQITAPLGVGLAQQLALGLAHSRLLFVEWINECYGCDSIRNIMFVVRKQFCVTLS